MKETNIFFRNMYQLYVVYYFFDISNQISYNNDTTIYLLIKYQKFDKYFIILQPIFQKNLDYSNINNLLFIKKRFVGGIK